MSSQSEAVGKLDRIRKIYIAGNRACALVTFPMIATVLILGKSIIEVWVGSKYVPLSYPVLVTLAIPMTLLMSQAASGRILIGMGRHRQLAMVSLIEGVGNLILSIALVRPLGIVGDALGTAIPMACTMLFFTPRHLKKQLGVPARTFLLQAYTLPVLLILPFVAVLLIMRKLFYAHHLWQLLLQAGAASVVYGAGLLWAYKTKRAFHVADLKEPAPEKIELQPVPALQSEYGEEV
jgi:O-antigen/teichoic acid export membrane protein